MSAERIVIYGPPELAEAAEVAARRRQMASRSEYVRHALFEALRADGIDPAPKQFAYVHEGHVVTALNGTPMLTAPRVSAPSDLSEFGDHAASYPADGIWLPVVNVDAGPYSPQRHYRGRPFLRVGAGVVERVYPIEERA